MRHFGWRRQSLVYRQGVYRDRFEFMERVFIMKAITLRDQGADELRQMCEDTKKELFHLKARKGVSDASEQPLKIRTLRRDIARIKTVIREMSLKGSEKIIKTETK